MSKLKIWNENTPWEHSESIWDQGAQQCAEQHPIKKLKLLPDMPGMTPDTAKHLKWKSLKWIIGKDDGTILKGFMRHPLRYALAFLRSLVKKKSFLRDGDFFLYGIKNVDEFKELLKLKHSLLVIGFSYCHKPFECPSGRFTDKCSHRPDHPVCRQCFIGKCVNALPENNVIPLFIPTIHYIGGKIFEIVHRNPDKQILFMITACEMTLEMFGDLGNMAGIKGIGVRLDGRICNTMKAFELSEAGIKPGLTVVLDKTQRRMLDLICFRRGASAETVYEQSAHEKDASGELANIHYSNTP